MIYALMVENRITILDWINNLINKPFSMDITQLSLYRNQAFINGKWQDAENGASLEVNNPADGSIIGSVPNMGKKETANAIAAAADAFLAWKSLLAKERAAIMMKWYELIMEHRQQLASIMVAEQGKPIKEALGEIAYTASFVSFYAEEGKRAYGEIIPSFRSHSQSQIVKEPIGVAGMITPWNFPAAMITRKAAAAIAAGCTCVIKPSDLTPYTALALIALTEEAEIPAGVINLVTGDAPPIGEEMTSNPTMRKISFTGSAAVGKLLMKQAADQVKKLSLELGGDAPFIIFEDADLDKAVDELIASKFRNTGQTCVCANRVILQRTIHNDFIARLKAKVEKFKIGSGFDEGANQGPLINEKAALKVERYIKEAIEKGAHLICGGKRHQLGGTFFQPTILTRITAAMPRIEIFGPVVPVYSFDSEQEAIDLANNTPYGLSAYFCTKDIARAYRVADKLQAGIVGVNCGIISTEVAPFGGVKESGFGREGGRQGLDEYMQIKHRLFDFS